MRTRHAFLRRAAGCLVLLTLSPPLVAGENAHTPLGIKQEGVASEYDALEQKLVSLVQALGKSEPEQAARLARAFKALKRERVGARLEAVAALLNRARLETAAGEQRQVLADLQRVLAGLLKEEDEYERLEQRIRRLLRWRSRVEKLLKDENAHRRESEKVSEREQELARLRRALARVRELRDEQQRLNRETAEAIKRGERDWSTPSRRQEELRRRAAAVQRDLAAKSGARAGERRPEPGESELARAAGEQAKAASNLGEEKPRSGAAHQERALKHLEQALKHLERERKRLASLPRDHEQRMASSQDSTRDSTQKLAKEMAASESREEKSPGKQSLDNASAKMQQASSQLRGSRSKQAAGSQRRAAKDLEQARRKLDKEIARLRRRQQAETLAKLDEIFKEMLMRQRSVSASTSKLQGRRKHWSRADDLACGELARGEEKIRDLADKALEMMRADGTPTVFPAVTRMLRGKVQEVVKRLDASDTGTVTRKRELEIEQQLKDLLAALAEAQDNPPPQSQQSQQGQQGQQGQQKQPPLVSLIAELKLLRAMQQRVNTGTVELDGKSGTPASAVEREAGRLAGEQREVHHLTRELVRKASKRK